MAQFEPAPVSGRKGSAVTKALFAACLVAFCAADHAAARQVRRPSRPSSIEKEISTLEARRFRAMTEGDLVALDSILADDLTYTHSNAVTQNKAEFIEALRSGKLRYLSIEVANETIRAYGTSAVGTGRANVKVNSEGKLMTMELRFTDVFAKIGGKWRLVAWQSTRLMQ
jgi:uncharacterized protein DUF4440